MTDYKHFNKKLLTKDNKCAKLQSLAELDACNLPAHGSVHCETAVYILQLIQE